MDFPDAGPSADVKYESQIRNRSRLKRLPMSTDIHKRAKEISIHLVPTIIPMLYKPSTAMN